MKNEFICFVQNVIYHKVSAFVRLKDRLKDFYWKMGGIGLKLLVDNHEKPFVNLVPKFQNSSVNEAFALDNQKWDHQEIIAEVNNVLVEPDCCYAVQGWRTIVSHSRKVGKFGVPSPFPVLAAKLRGSSNRLDTAFLFDGTLGINYFYFHADLISKIYLLREHYDLSETPVLIGKDTFNKPYFKQLLEYPDFTSIKWQVVSQVIHVDRLIIAKPNYFRKNRFQRLKKVILSDKVSNTQTRKLFIDRSNRRISNMESIRELLNEYGFECINPEELPISEQAKLFNSASHVIGIHGAGLTNIVYCEPGKTKVLELTPSVLIHTHYYWLSQTLGLEYDVLVGKSTAGVYDDFEIDPSLFHDKLKEFMKS